MAFNPDQARDERGRWTSGSVVEYKAGKTTYHAVVTKAGPKTSRVHVPYFGSGGNKTVQNSSLSLAPGFIQPGSATYVGAGSAETEAAALKEGWHPEDAAAAAIVPEPGETVTIHGANIEQNSLGGTDANGKPIRGALIPEETSYEAEGRFGSAPIPHSDLAQGAGAASAKMNRLIRGR